MCFYSVTFLTKLPSSERYVREIQHGFRCLRLVSQKSNPARLAGAMQNGTAKFRRVVFVRCCDGTRRLRLRGNIRVSGIVDKCAPPFRCKALFYPVLPSSSSAFFVIPAKGASPQKSSSCGKAGCQSLKKVEPTWLNLRDRGVQF